MQRFQQSLAAAVLFVLAAAVACGRVGIARISVRNIHRAVAGFQSIALSHSLLLFLSV